MKIRIMEWYYQEVTTIGYVRKLCLTSIPPHPTHSEAKIKIPNFSWSYGLRGGRDLVEVLTRLPWWGLQILIKQKEDRRLRDSNSRGETPCT